MPSDLLTDPYLFALSVGPLIVLTVVCAVAHVRLGRGPWIPSHATNHALVASWLTLAAFTFFVLQGIALSHEGTAILSVLTIGPSGLLLAGVVFPIVWAASVVAQSLFVRRGRRPGETWSLPLACVILLAVSAAIAAGMYARTSDDAVPPAPATAGGPADGKWRLMAPPSTWRWRHPFTSVLDGDAPLDAWHPVMKPFESRDACETLRAELARRESNPRLQAAPRVDGEFPRDFYTRSRCALLASPGPTS